MTALAARIDRGLERLYRLCGYAAALCMALIAVLVTLSIVTRLMSVYVAGLTEYSGYAMAAASFLALAYTFGEKGHIRVELLLSRLGPAARRAAEIWCLAVATLVAGFLAVYMCRLVYFSYRFEERSEGADAILLWLAQTPAMIGAVVMAIAVAHQLVRCLSGTDGDRREAD